MSRPAFGRLLSTYVLLTGFVWTLAGCRKQTAQPQAAPAQTLDGIARSYVRLAVALGDRDSDSIDYYDGPADWVADIRKQAPPLGQIRQSSLELMEQLHTMAVPDELSASRKSFLTGQLQAVACRAGMLMGVPSTFDEETKCSFGVTAPATYDEKALAATRAKLAQLLPGTGPLLQRYAKFEARFAIPPAKLHAVMQRAIDGCRAQTAKRVTLPADEAIELVFTGNEPWAGYSLYKGAHKSVVTINTDFAVTLDRALDLACHEAYPGHHTYNMTQDDTLVRHGYPELAVQPTYSPQSFLSEGAATIASEIAFTPEQRLAFEREELLPLSGLGAQEEKDLARYLEVEALVDELHTAIPAIAREYLDGRLEFARAGQALETEALMGNTFDMLKYLNEFRSYVVTYTCGPDVLNGYLPHKNKPNSEEIRWQTYLHWMHTESTVSQHLH
jgi:hypothetical protein